MTDPEVVPLSPEEALRAAFAETFRRYVTMPEQGADSLDAAIADALHDAEARVLAALLSHPRPPTDPRCATCGLPDRGHDDSHGFHPRPPEEPFADSPVERDSYLAGWRDAYARLRPPETPGVREKPPVKWSTIREDATERGLFSVVDEAMIGRKLTPSRRRLIVGNIVMAVAKWRESFRDCGCWKTEAGFALCDWHERAFRPQREEAERLAALAARPPEPSDLDVAWREAEAALPEGWDLSLMSLRKHIDPAKDGPEVYAATASAPADSEHPFTRVTSSEEGRPRGSKHDATPAAALRALAERLRAVSP